MSHTVPTSHFLVRIACSTYNHAKFIAVALEGFVSQRTSFPFVVTVIDDASTDGTQNVLADYHRRHSDPAWSAGYERDTEYGNVTFFRHKENSNCHFAVICLRENHYSQKRPKGAYIKEWSGTEFLALCEGDDYWTDPFKLQKQVDYLEAHPDCTLCIHNAVEHWEDGSTPDRPFSELENRDYSGPELCERWTAPTASAVLRTSVLSMYQEIYQKVSWPVGDLPLFLCCASRGKVHALPDVMAVYRKHPDGFTSRFDAMRFYAMGKFREEIPSVFGKEYEPSAVIWSTWHYTRCFALALSEKNFKLAAKAFQKSFLRHPSIALRRFILLLKERRNKHL